MLLERLMKTDEVVNKQGKYGKKECPHVPYPPPNRTNMASKSIPGRSSQGLSVGIVGDVSHEGKDIHILSLKQQQTGILPLNGRDPKGVLTP